MLAILNSSQFDKIIRLNLIFPQWTWWSHDIETLSKLVGLYVGNPLVTYEFPQQSASNVELWHFFVSLNMSFNKQLSCQWCQMPSLPCNITVMHLTPVSDKLMPEICPDCTLSHLCMRKWRHLKHNDFWWVLMSPFWGSSWQLVLWGTHTRELYHQSDHNSCLSLWLMTREHFVNVPSQWETMLHHNSFSHWLGTYKKWSLNDLAGLSVWVETVFSWMKMYEFWLRFHWSEWLGTG